MTKYNEKFANSVTTTAFDLRLSKNMAITLAAIATNSARLKTKEFYAAFNMVDRYVCNSKALKEKGLVYAPDPKYKGIVELTEAGEHVVALLEIAGIIKKVKVVNEQLFGKEELTQQDRKEHSAY